MVFLSINLNICFGCSKEPSHWDSSFEDPQHIFESRSKKTYLKLHALIWWPIWLQQTDSVMSSWSLPLIFTDNRQTLSRAFDLCHLLWLTMDRFCHELLVFATYFHWQQTTSVMSSCSLPLILTDNGHTLFHELLVFATYLTNNGQTLSWALGLCHLSWLTTDKLCHELLIFATYYGWQWTDSVMSSWSLPLIFTHNRQTLSWALVLCHLLWLTMDRLFHEL